MQHPIGVLQVFLIGCMQMDLVLNVLLGYVDLTLCYGFNFIFLSFRRSWFECFSLSLRLFLNSLFELLWSFQPIDDKSCLFLCPLFILFMKFFYQKSKWSCCCSRLHTDTCQDLTFMLLITSKLAGRSMRLVLFLTSGLSASCADMLMANKPEWGSSMNPGTVPVTIHGVQFVGTISSATLVVA